MRTALLGVLVVMAGCTKPAAEVKNAGGQVALVAPSAAPAGPTASGEAFEVALSSAGGEVTASVKAKPGFHVNAEYPLAFRPEAVDGDVTFAGERVALEPKVKTPCVEKAEDVCALEAPVPFKTKETAEPKVSGVLAFSVCSADKCLIEKVPLKVAVAK